MTFLKSNVDISLVIYHINLSLYFEAHLRQEKVFTLMIPYCTFFFKTRN